MTSATVICRNPAQATGGEAASSVSPTFAGGAFLGRENGLERSPPAGAERRDAQRPRHLAAVVPGEVEQGVDVGDAHPLWAHAHLHGAMGASVSGKVALPVTVDVERPHPLRAVNRLLPHPGVHGPPAP
jgi:hypothetical protein